MSDKLFDKSLDTKTLLKLDELLNLNWFIVESYIILPLDKFKFDNSLISVLVYFFKITIWYLKFDKFCLY